jgi:hypothetical protein
VGSGGVTVLARRQGGLDVAAMALEALCKAEMTIERSAQLVGAECVT